MNSQELHVLACIFLWFVAFTCGYGTWENVSTPKYYGLCTSQVPFSLRSNPHVIVVYECVLERIADVLR